MQKWHQLEGAPFPMGASWVPKEAAYNFALYSANADSVRLLFYDQDGVETPAYTFDFDHLVNKSGPVWHCRIPRARIADARYYAYQVTGPAPNAEFSWHSFDSEKLLVDPYARDVYFPPRFSREAAQRPGSNEGMAPLAVLQNVECVFDWEDDQPVHHGSDLIIYEMHVRGFTRRENSGVPETHRGKFLGIVDKIPYLVSARK